MRCFQQYALVHLAPAKWFHQRAKYPALADGCASDRTKGEANALHSEPSSLTRFGEKVSPQSVQAAALVGTGACHLRTSVS